MCYAASCDPTCGNCRPKRILTIDCPACGAPAKMGRDEFLIYFDLPHEMSMIGKMIAQNGGPKKPVCKSCGIDLSDAFQASMPPAECAANGIVCGFPCGRKDDPAGAAGCTTTVPVALI